MRLTCPVGHNGLLFILGESTRPRGVYPGSHSSLQQPCSVRTRTVTFASIGVTLRWNALGCALEDTCFSRVTVTVTGLMIVGSPVGSPDREEDAPSRPDSPPATIKFGFEIAASPTRTPVGSPDREDDALSRPAVPPATMTGGFEIVASPIGTPVGSPKLLPAPHAVAIGGTDASTPALDGMDADTGNPALTGMDAINGSPARDGMDADVSSPALAGVEVIIGSPVQEGRGECDTVDRTAEGSSPAVPESSVIISSPVHRGEAGITSDFGEFALRETCSGLFAKRKFVLVATELAAKGARCGHELSRPQRLAAASRSPAASPGSDLLGPEPSDVGPPDKSTMKQPSKVDAWKLGRSADHLLALLPNVCKIFLIGGQAAVGQSMDATERRNTVLDAVKSHGGRSGQPLEACCDALALLALEAERRGLEDGGISAEGGISSLLLRAIIMREDKRAREHSADSAQGGASVAHGTLTSFKKLADHFGLPVDTRAAAVLAAVPQQLPNPRTKAGTPPMALYPAFDFLCNVLPPGPFRHWARSFTAFMLYQNTRVQDLLEPEPIGVETEQECPSGVIHARVRLSKFGGPMHVFAPCEGVSGPFRWIAEHLQDVKVHGVLPRFQSTPAWDLAAPSVSFVAGTVDVDETRKGFYSILRSAPLFIDEQMRSELGLRGHGPHSAFNDVGWFVGAVDVDGGRGFDEKDNAVFGHWGHVARANEEAANRGVLEAVAAARGRSAGRGSGRGRTHTAVGDAGVRTAVGYSTGDTHIGDRQMQVEARLRMVRLIRRKISEDGRGFFNLPPGRADWRLMKAPTPSPRVLAHISIGCLGELQQPQVPGIFYIDASSGPLALPFRRGPNDDDGRFHLAAILAFEALMADREVDLDEVLRRGHAIVAMQTPSLGNVIATGGGVIAVSELCSNDAWQARIDALQPSIDCIARGQRVRFLCSCCSRFRARCHCDAYARFLGRCARAPR